MSSLLSGNSQVLLYLMLLGTVASCWLTSRWISYLSYFMSCGLAYWYHAAESLGFIYC